MNDRVEQRLHQLRAEFESGQKLLRDLEARQQELRDTLLRIGGAIRVLQEILEQGDPTGT